VALKINLKKTGVVDDLVEINFDQKLAGGPLLTKINFDMNVRF